MKYDISDRLRTIFAATIVSVGALLWQPASSQAQVEFKYTYKLQGQTLNSTERKAIEGWISDILAHDTQERSGVLSKIGLSSQFVDSLRTWKNRIPTHSNRLIITIRSNEFSAATGMFDVEFQAKGPAAKRYQQPILQPVQIYPFFSSRPADHPNSSRGRNLEAVEQAFSRTPHEHRHSVVVPRLLASRQRGLATTVSDFMIMTEHRHPQARRMLKSEAVQVRRLNNERRPVLDTMTRTTIDPAYVVHHHLAEQVKGTGQAPRSANWQLASYGIVFPDPDVRTGPGVDNWKIIDLRPVALLHDQSRVEMSSVLTLLSTWNNLYGPDPELSTMRQSLVSYFKYLFARNPYWVAGLWLLYDSIQGGQQNRSLPPQLVEARIIEPMPRPSYRHLVPRGMSAEEMVKLIGEAIVQSRGQPVPPAHAKSRELTVKLLVDELRVFNGYPKPENPTTYDIWNILAMARRSKVDGRSTGVADLRGLLIGLGIGAVEQQSSRALAALLEGEANSRQAHPHFDLVYVPRDFDSKELTHNELQAKIEQRGTSDPHLVAQLLKMRSGLFRTVDIYVLDHTRLQRNNPDSPNVRLITPVDQNKLLGSFTAVDFERAFGKGGIELGFKADRVISDCLTACCANDGRCADNKRLETAERIWNEPRSESMGIRAAYRYLGALVAAWQNPRKAVQRLYQWEGANMTGDIFAVTPGNRVLTEFAGHDHGVLSRESGFQAFVREGGIFDRLIHHLATNSKPHQVREFLALSGNTESQFYGMTILAINSGEIGLTQARELLAQVQHASLPEAWIKEASKFGLSFDARLRLYSELMEFPSGEIDRTRTEEMYGRYDRGVSEWHRGLFERNDLVRLGLHALNLVNESTAEVFQLFDRLAWKDHVDGLMRFRLSHAHPEVHKDAIQAIRRLFVDVGAVSQREPLIKYVLSGCDVETAAKVFHMWSTILLDESEDLARLRQEALETAKRLDYPAGGVVRDWTNRLMHNRVSATSRSEVVGNLRESLDVINGHIKLNKLPAAKSIQGEALLAFLIREIRELHQYFNRDGVNEHQERELKSAYDRMFEAAMRLQEVLDTKARQASHLVQEGGVVEFAEVTTYYRGNDSHWFAPRAALDSLYARALVAAQIFDRDHQRSESENREAAIERLFSPLETTPRFQPLIEAVRSVRARVTR